MDDYKIAVIYGKDDQEKNIKDGMIEAFGDIHDQDLLHIDCILEHARKKYPEVAVFKQLTDRHSPEAVAYFYTQLGNAVFFNSTKEPEKYGYSGVLMLPDDLTDNQIQSLQNLSKKISKYIISISYDFKVEDGIIECQEINSLNQETPEELLKKYFARSSKVHKSK